MSTQFLSLFPDSQGGVTPIASCLLHADAAVRLAAFRLLRRLDSIPEGELFVSSLNYFLLYVDRTEKSDVKLFVLLSFLFFSVFFLLLQTHDNFHVTLRVCLYCRGAWMCAD
jgi:hypothetical protein